mgnify:FL=1
MPCLRSFIVLLLATLGLTLGVALVDTRPAVAVDLTPHRALYNMSLASADRGSSVNGASGSMVYSFWDNCDSWAAETNVKLKLIYADNGEIETNWSFASWEAKDGKSFRFHVRHTRDGSLVETLKGTVRRAHAADAADALFSAPKDKVITLPAGTLFPTRHLIDLISAGEEGRPIFRRTVFDGTSLDNPYEINAIISRDGAVGSKQVNTAQQLFREAGLKSEAVRHVRMAFFSAGSKNPEPEFELGVDYRRDGIARAIRQDFGDFVVDLTPESIGTLAGPEC